MRPAVCHAKSVKGQLVESVDVVLFSMSMNRRHASFGKKIVSNQVLQ
jgi:hypothetical protein